MTNWENAQWESRLSRRPIQPPNWKSRRVPLKKSAREHEIVQTDQLTIPAFVQNDAARCFHCKTDLYQLMDGLRIARSMQWVLDGTNLDDLGDDRPGIKAAREWNVRSPLVEASLTKADVRAAAHNLGLSSWDKPAAACLSSRIPRGIPITMESSGASSRPKPSCRQKGFAMFGSGTMATLRESKSLPRSSHD